MTAPVMTTTPFTTDTRMTPQGFQTAQSEDKSLRELISKFADDGSKLLRQESELAKRELKDKADEIQERVVEATIGGAVLYAGALAVVAGVILLLGLAIPYWLSALLVGVAVAVAGVVMLKHAKDKDTNLKPERTIRNVRRDAYVIKEAAR